MTRRRVATTCVVAALVVAPATLVGCDKQPTPGGPTTTTQPPLPFEGSTSKAGLQKAAGLRFPASSTDYRATRVGEGELDVTFRYQSGETDSFIAGSKLPALRDERVLLHPSPLWDLDPGGPVRSTTDTRNGLRIALEIVDGGETSTVRLVVASGG